MPVLSLSMGHRHLALYVHLELSIACSSGNRAVDRWTFFFSHNFSFRLPTDQLQLQLKSLQVELFLYLLVTHTHFLEVTSPRFLTLSLCFGNDRGVIQGVLLSCQVAVYQVFCPWSCKRGDIIFKGLLLRV